MSKLIISSKPSVALVRGKFLNQYEAQVFSLLSAKYHLTAFSSNSPIHTQVSFPVQKLFSPVDIVPYLASFGISQRMSMGMLNRLLVDANYLWGLEKELEGFDIAHVAETYYHFTIQALLAKKNGRVKKVISTVWENIVHNNEGIWGRKSFKKRAFAEIDHFIATTQTAAEVLLQEGVAPQKISVIYPGVDLKRFTPAKKSNQPSHILFVGRLEKEKGVWLLLSAFELLLLRYPFLQVRFCGAGGESQHMKKYIKDRGISHVSFEHVSYDRLPSVYKWADIVVVPSQSTTHWQEQFGMVIVEALASGCAVVGVKTGAIPEVVGSAGMLVENTKSALTAGIELVLNNDSLYSSLRKKARHRAEALFDREKTAKKISDVYTKILQQ